MTQTNNEREALKKALLELECYKGEILLDGDRPNDLRDVNETILIVKSAISQNEHQEAVAYAWEYESPDKTWKSITTNKTELQDHLEIGCTLVRELFTSPPKQIPDGWKPIETAPKGESVLVAGGDCNYPCVANWSGHHEDVWCVDGQMDSYAEIGWPTHWIPLDSLPELPTAPTLKEKG